MVHWGLYLSSKGREPCVIAPDVMSYTGYVRITLLIKEQLHLWDYPQEILGRMDQDHLGCLWKEILYQTPGRIIEVAAQAALKYYGEEGLTRKRELYQSVGVVTPMRKRKKRTGKYWEERVE